MTPTPSGLLACYEGIVRLCEAGVTPGWKDPGDSRAKKAREGVISRCQDRIAALRG